MGEVFNVDKTILLDGKPLSLVTFVLVNDPDDGGGHVTLFDDMTDRDA